VAGCQGRKDAVIIWSQGGGFDCHLFNINYIETEHRCYKRDGERLSL
jgi:hypothetical protein